jgi:uncharacterized protein (DUF983 family)
MTRRTTVLLRGIHLRCPHCGGGGLFRHWLQMADNCPTCGYSLAAGNRVGANLLNLVVAEFILMVGIAVIVARTWPDIPWTLLQWGAPAMMVLCPLFFYPFSKMVFVAFDLAAHPDAQPDLKVHGVE